MTTPADLTQQGITAVKAGDKARAYTLFKQALTLDPQNEQAWLWLSGTVEHIDEQRYCLERVLALNPDNMVARRGLEALMAALAATPPGNGSSTAQMAPAVLPPPALAEVLAEVHAGTQASAADRNVALAVVEPPPQPSALPVLPKGSGRKQNSYYHKRGEVVNDYLIVERVGKEDLRELYVAQREDRTWRFWLLRSDMPLETLPISGSQELFQGSGGYYLVVPMAGTSAATLGKMVSMAQYRFVGPRWVEFAYHVGHLHKTNNVYQRDNAFALESILFNGSGTASLVSFTRLDRDSRTFPAPEAAQGTLTPASDVYSLGASMLAVMGQPAPEELFGQQIAPSELLEKVPLLRSLFEEPLRVEGPLGNHPELCKVLQRATHQNPLKRYKNGEEFAIALGALLRKLPPDDEAQPVRQRPPRRSLRWLFTLFASLLMLIVIGSVYWLYNPPQSAQPDPMTSTSLSTEVPTVPPSPTIVPLSAGPLSIDELKIEETAVPGGRRATLKLSKGGEPLPQQVDVSFEVLRNEQAVPNVTYELTGESMYALSFAGDLVPSTYEMVVKLGDEVVRAKVFFAAKDALKDTAQPVTDLSQVTVSALQVDARQYPTVKTYFGLVDQQGEARVLEGSFDVSVALDGEAIDTFEMAPVDPAADPLTVALVVDVSGSMRGAPIEAARQAAAEFVRQLRPNDKACLYYFATLVRKAQDCTSDHEATIAAIMNLVPQDDTSLYDALVRVTTDQVKEGGRQAIVVLSDGADTDSKASLETALAQIRQSNIPVYTLGLLSSNFDGNALRGMASQADAIYLEAPKTEDIQKLYKRIEDQLRSQYVISFVSPFPERSAGTVTIRIERDGVPVEFSRNYKAQ